MTADDQNRESACFQESALRALPLHANSRQSCSVLRVAASACRQVKRVYEALLESKEERWDQCRGGVADCLRELAEHHGGEVCMSRSHKLFRCIKS